MVPPWWWMSRMTVAALAVEIPIGRMGALTVASRTEFHLVVAVPPVLALLAIGTSRRGVTTWTMRRGGCPWLRMGSMSRWLWMMIAMPSLVLLLKSLQSGDLVVQLLLLFAAVVLEAHHRVDAAYSR